MFLIKCGKILDPLCSSQKLVWLANFNLLVAIYRVAVLFFGLICSLVWHGSRVHELCKLVA